MTSSKPQVLIVEASAGSGKTYALAKRYLWLLFSEASASTPTPLDSILAITFTNKAAIEMKARIVEFLKSIALDRFSRPGHKSDLLGSLGVRPQEAQRLAFKVMEDILRNYNYFQVQTIDSFINAILSACAFKLGLSAVFKVREDHSEYIAYSLDKLIEKAASDKQVSKALQEFIHQYLMLEYKSGWFAKPILFDTLCGLFSKDQRITAALCRSKITTGQLLETSRKLQADIRHLSRIMPSATHKTLARNIRELSETEPGFLDPDSVSSFFRRPDFPASGGAAAQDVRLRKLWESIRQGLSRFCEERSVSTFDCYVRIHELLLKELVPFTEAQDVLLLESLNKQAHALFYENIVGVPELYFRLACRFRHFLIDEFQDTSRLQLDNLLPMIEEALSTGGTLFYVGDRKQAIYRFRGGEVSLIDALQDHLSTSIIAHSSLSSNYRSCPVIVEFNNRVFSPDNMRSFCEGLSARDKSKELATEEAEKIAAVFRDSRQESAGERDCGYVRVKSLEASGGRPQGKDIAQEVPQLVRSLLDRFNAGQIAVLARTNSEVETVTGWLLENGIAVESERTLDIRRHPLIKEFVSFLRFLDSPIDDSSFASFILGSIFQAHSGMERKELESFIFGLHRSAQRVYLYRAFRDKFEAVWDRCLEDFFVNVGHIPLYELAVSAVAALRIFERFPGAQGFFMRLLELIKSKEEDYGSIASFLGYFDTARPDDFYVTARESSSVKVLTVHKAKGLEFEAVVIPFFQVNPKVDTQLLVRDGKQTRLLYLKKKFTEFSSTLQDIYRSEYVKSLIDELNTLYVACTRASRELYVFVVKDSLACGLLPCADADYGSVPRQMHKAAAPEGAILMPASRYSDWISVLSEESFRESGPVRQTQALKGQFLHEVLSMIGLLSAGSRDAVIDDALSRVSALYGRDFEGARKMIDSVIDNPALKEAFFGPDAQIECEQEICDDRGNLRRIDRIAVLPDRVLVIDYKLQRLMHSQHLQQLRRYLGLVSSLYPQKRSQGFLVYLDTGDCESV